MDGEIAHDIACLERAVSELVWIRIQRDKFKILLEDEENRRILSSAASQFFYEFNIMMIHDINLTIARLTDPYDSKNRNLSLEYFLKSKNIKRKEELDAIYKKICGFRDKIKKGRNKIISHNDIQTLLCEKTYAQFEIGEDLECIDNIGKFLNIVSEDLKGETFGDICTSCSGDANDLLKILKYGLEVKKMWNSSNDELKEIAKCIITNVLTGKQSSPT